MTVNPIMVMPLVLPTNAAEAVLGSIDHKAPLELP